MNTYSLMHAYFSIILILFNKSNIKSILLTIFDISPVISTSATVPSYWNWIPHINTLNTQYTRAYRAAWLPGTC